MHPIRQSARFRLREGTADCHERVDALFSAVALGCRAGYESFLVSQATAFLPAERSLDAGGIVNVLADWPSRRRSHLLVEDLTTLGLQVPLGEIALSISGVPALLGCAYVLEGSRLGGKLLRQEVAADMPTAFLSDSYPKAWPTMVAVLDEQLREESAIDEAIEAARALFALFESGGQHMRQKDS